jgi:riboflavin synthase
VFTGLIQDIGNVESVVVGPSTDFWIRTAMGASEFTLGESVAVLGACLTVVEIRGDLFKVQAGPETLRCTTLGALKAGDSVHLERAMKLGDRLGGHLVLGHVDGVAQVLSARADAGAWEMEISLPTDLAPFFILKGSVTVDGVSLTVNRLLADRFSVALIPETQTRTLLAKLRVGASVNLEADVIGKYVARLHGLQGLARPVSGGISEETLRAAGFGG